MGTNLTNEQFQFCLRVGLPTPRERRFISLESVLDLSLRKCDLWFDPMVEVYKNDHQLLLQMHAKRNLLRAQYSMDVIYHYAILEHVRSQDPFHSYLLDTKLEEKLEYFAFHYNSQ